MPAGRRLPRTHEGAEDNEPPSLPEGPERVGRLLRGEDADLVEALRQVQRAYRFRPAC